MRNVLRLALAAACAAAITAAPATASPQNPCDEDIDFACSYCSYQGSDTAYHGSHCYYREPGYDQVICAVWMNYECLVRV